MVMTKLSKLIIITKGWKLKKYFGFDCEWEIEPDIK